MIRRSRSAAWFMGVALLASAAPPKIALGQQRAGVLEEVVVSARKREEAAIDVPTTLQVLSGEALDREGIRDFSQIQQTIPNFNFYSDRAARSVFTLRGFGATTSTNLAPGVGLYVDGVYQPSTAFFNAPLVDLERLEFLKGPQGTLFGRNAYAGAINVVTRRPSDELDARVQAEIANGGTQRAFASLSGPLVEGRLRGLLSAGFQEQEGFFRYSTTGNEVDPNDYVIARGRLSLEVSERLTFDLTGQYFDLDTGGFKVHAVSGVDATNEDIRLNEPQYEKAEFADLWLNATWSLGDVDIVGISSYSDQTNDSLLDGDLTSSVLITSARLQDRKLWSQEFRAQSTGEQRFRWLVGVYYGESEVINAQTNRGGFFPTGPLVTNGREDSEIRSVFTDFAFDLTDRFELGAGLRYDEIDKEGVSGNTRLTTAGPVSLSSASLGDTYDDIQPKVSLRYRLLDEATIYATYSTGFREGGLNLNAPGSPVQSFGSDEVKSYELGFKSVAAGGRIEFNAAGFFMEAPIYNSTGIFVNPLGGATLVTVSVGAFESYGVEADVSALLNEHWSLNASAGYNKTKFTSVTNNAVGIEPGDPGTLTPEWAFNASARGNFPLASEGLTLEFTAAVTAKGDTLLSSLGGGDFIRSPYAVFDLSVGLEKNHWRAVLFGRNLTDERYGEVFSPAALLAAFGSVDDVIQYAQPRTYGVRLEYRY